MRTIRSFLSHRRDSIHASCARRAPSRLQPRLLGVIAGLALFSAAGQASANLLLNPGFEVPDPNIPSGFIDHGSAQASWFAGWGTAAESWPATSNDLNYGAIATWLQSDVIHGGSSSLLVSATTTNGGIAQQYLPTGQATPAHQRFSVYLYVVTGQVFIGLGAGATGFATASSDPTKLNQWQLVSVCAPPVRSGGTSNTNLVLIYTANGEPAIYYADDASVTTPQYPSGPYICP